MISLHRLSRFRCIYSRLGKGNSIRLNTSYASPVASLSVRHDYKTPWQGSTNSGNHTKVPQQLQSSTTRRSRILETTQNLLAPTLSTSSNSTNYPLRKFEQILASVREDRTQLNMMQLSSDGAKDMYILPTELLHQVHSSVIYFSKEANFQGMVITPDNNNPDMISNKKSKKIKVPGPMICAHMLELIGIPHHYLHVSLNNSKPTTIHVHSSQIDFILECCMETVLALSRSCEVGRHSLIGTDFNNNVQTALSPISGDIKTAAQLCEEIWRSVYNIEIKYTSKRTTNIQSDAQLPQQVKIGRIGSLQMNNNAIVEYLSAMNFDKQKDDECEFIDELEGTSWETLKPTARDDDEDDLPWTAKDQRRYDKATILFNSTLSSYAKLSSSMSGLPPQVRRDFVQTCERLLLEVAAKRDQIKDPTPNTILQCIQPNVVSFNTALSAWSSFSSKQRKGRQQQDDKSADDSVATAERTQSILQVMQDVNDQTRSNRSTLQSIESAWTERRGHNAINEEHFTSPTTRMISPNTTSYNNVLKALSRTSNTNETALQSLNMFQSIMNRANKHHHARGNLVLSNCEQLQKRSIDPGRARDILPDSRTLVLLLINLQNLSLSNFQDSLAVVNSIYQSMLQFDEQLQWSVDNLQESSRSALLNKYSFNAILKTLSSLCVDSYDDSYECATQIDDIVEQAVHEYSIKSSDIRPNAIKAWAKCALLAGTDKERLRTCARKCGAHIEELFAELNQTKDDRNNTGSYHLIQAINDTISLYGRVGLFLEAHALYKQAQACGLASLKTLSTTTEALCQASRDIEQIDKAKQLLLDYEQEVMGNQSNVLPDMKYTYIYNSLIEAYLTNGTSRGLEEANSLLSYMISSHESNLRHIARPNTTSFVIVMAALAQRGQHIHRLESLLAKMEEMSQRKKNANNELVANVIPNDVVYNIMLKGYSLSKDDETLDSAMKLLDRMETDSDIKPLDSVSNSYVLDLLSRKDSADNVRNANTSRGSNLNSQNQDSVETFNSLMKGVPTMEDAEKGAALLQQIEERYRNGKSEIKPDIKLYNKLMKAWRLCGEPERANAILDSIIDKHEAGDDDSLCPSDESFSICIQAWTQSNQSDAAERAEKILWKKEEYANTIDKIVVKPSDYFPIIPLYKQDQENGSKRATKLFEQVLEKYDNSSHKPDSHTLNALLDVYAKSKKGGNQAEHVLKHMNNLHEENKTSILPDVISYRSVIDAWIQMWSKDSPERVEALVNEMIDKYKNEGRDDLCPDTNLFNLILKACCHAPAMYASNETGNNHPIAIANRTFSTLRRKNEYGATATHATFSYMFHIFRQHMDFFDKRYKPVMDNLWKACCQDGHVSQFTLESFRDSVLEEHFLKAIGGMPKGKDLKTISVADLTKAWSRNVTSKQRKRK